VAIAVAAGSNCKLAVGGNNVVIVDEKMNDYYQAMP